MRVARHWILRTPMPTKKANIQLFLGIFLLGLVVACGSEKEPASGIASPSAASAGQAFLEVGEASGADFLHYRHPDDAMAFGGGLVVFDYNNDNLSDIYVTASRGANALYRNNGDGTFTDVAGPAGVDDPDGKGNGGCAGDYDNDGHRDLFVANFGSSRLFRNTGNNSFDDVTDELAVGDPGPSYRTMGCSWGDYDKDGFLDLVIVRHMSEFTLKSIEVESFAGAVRPMALYRNNGDGGFDNVTALLGDITTPLEPDGRSIGNVWGSGFQPGWMDFDNDGDLDLYVVNDFGADVQPNVLWRNDGADNNGEWRFVDVSSTTGADVGMFGMGLAVGDYNLDGSLDFYMTNMGKSVLLSNNIQVKGFTDATNDAQTGLDDVEGQQRISWGTVFFDYDNDGDEDLYVASGYLDAFPDNDQSQPNVLLRNDGDGAFADVSNESGAADSGIGRGVAYLDYNNDGCLDLYVVNIGLTDESPQRSKLFRNACNWGNHWLVLNLAGTQSNRDAVGARVTVTAGGRTQIREVAAGGSSGSQNMGPVHFGLGKTPMVERIDILWPGGLHQTLRDVEADQRLNVTQPAE